MHDSSCARRVLSALPWLFAPGFVWGHAMPTHLAADQTWRLWPGGVVYYEFVAAPIDANGWVLQPQHPVDAATRQAIVEAMRHIEQKTERAVLFIASPDHPRRVRFSLMPDSPDRGFCGMASVGFLPAHATLQITDRAECKTRAVALHELMHTLGFLHENQRFQAIMDRERRPKALAEYADPRTTVDFDSITYNDGLQGERLDALGDPADTLLVRLRHGPGNTGRWFQELSTEDVAAIRKYYHPDNTLAQQLARARRERPWLRFERFELGNGQCLQTGAPKKDDDWRELYVARCDTVSAGQRWALDDQGALHSLAYPGQCVVKHNTPAHPESRGDIAVLRACRPGDARQHWDTRGLRLINRAQPHLMLGYQPQTRHVLAWWEQPDLRADWQRHAAPAARPAGEPRPPLPPPDPWRHALHTREHAAHALYRLQLGQRCLTDAGPDARLRTPGERLARLTPCQASNAAQQWILDQGRLASRQHPGHCLGNTGLHQATDDARPAFVGLQRCVAGRPSQRWALRHIQGSPRVAITTRLNPLIADDVRLLAALPDGLLHFATTDAPRETVLWQPIAEPIAGERPAVRTAPPPPAALPALAPGAGQPIVLQGGNLPLRGARLCLSAQESPPPGFAADERGVAARDCDGTAAQRWIMQKDGRVTPLASPWLCLGRNQTRQGQARHGSYRALAYRYTGHAALQPCRAGEPTQHWTWRATRFHHQDETPGNRGAQLVLSASPDLSLIVHGKARGPQLTIGQADIADNHQFFRWQPTQDTAMLAGAPGGARRLDWARLGASWQRDRPDYIGQGINMAEERAYRQLVWQDSQRCLSLRPDGAWRLTLAACETHASAQRWRVDAQYRLVNQRHPFLCLQRSPTGVTLGACGQPQALPHWFLNDSHQLDSLDWAPRRLSPGRHGDIALDDAPFTGMRAGWRWR